LQYHRRLGGLRTLVALTVGLVVGSTLTVHSVDAEGLPDGPIRIAVVGPMSGNLGEYGKLMREAAELAVADINAAGGVLGKPLELIQQDDRCDVQQAKAIAEQVAARQPVAVIGHFCSGVSRPASQVYYRRHILMISPASSNPRLTEEAASEGMNNVFRISGRDDQEGDVAAELLLNDFSGKRIAIVSDGSKYGAMIAGIVLDGLKSRDAVPILHTTVEEDRNDYSDLVDRLIEDKIDVLFFGGYHKEAAVIVRQMRERGSSAAFLAPDSLMTEEFATLAGPAAEGVRFVALTDHRKLAAAREVFPRLGVTKFDLAEYGLTTYASVQVFAAAVERAKSIDVDDVAAALRAETFDTVVGTIAFDDKGDFENLFWQWYRFANGAIVPLD
jgi:branched-chain amino acid transport system substrate-binding protein